MAEDQSGWYNSQEPTRNESIAVGTTSVVVSETRISPNKRKEMVIRNISTDPTMIITINLGLAQATANAGIVLRQYDTITISDDTKNECYQGVITAICAVAGGTLSVYER